VINSDHHHWHVLNYQDEAILQHIQFLSHQYKKAGFTDLAKAVYDVTRMKKIGQNGALAYPGTFQIFWVPPIITGTGKDTNFKFGQYIYRVHPNKSP